MNFNFKYLILTLIVTIIGWENLNAQIITTIAGDGGGGICFDGSQATASPIKQVNSIIKDRNGNMLITSFNISDSVSGSRIKKISSSGIISTFAGKDTLGFSGDGGPATNAKLYAPSGLIIDKKGNVYISDFAVNLRVRKVDTTGIITTFAGNGYSTSSGDGGPATSAGIGKGSGICIDSIGNIYIAAGRKIRKIDTFGIISTFAGDGTGVYSGDGGPATAAGIGCFGQITFDRHGNMLITDDNNRIRKIDHAGIISTIAGTGVAGFSGDGGPATAAQLYGPAGVYADNCDNIYISDGGNNRIRMVNGVGIIKTIAGTGVMGYGGDNGPATAAKFKIPTGLYLDNSGSIYIADASNFRVRYIHMDSCKNSTEVAEAEVEAGVMSVYPNPCNGSFIVKVASGINEPVSVVVTNIMGQKVGEYVGVSNMEVAMDLQVPAGVYFIQASMGKERYVGKVVVE